MTIVLIIIAVGFVSFIALGMYGNTKQKGFEENARQEIQSKGLTLTKQTKTDYGIIGIDEPNKKLVIVNSELTSQKTEIIDFSDIFACELLIDSQSVYKKSTIRTVGGAIVGGAVLGGAGAIVGGLSGSSKERKDIKQIELKLTVKSISNPIRKFKFYGDGTNNTFLSMRKGQAEEWKDTISIIIDTIDSNNK